MIAAARNAPSFRVVVGASAHSMLQLEVIARQDPAVYTMNSEAGVFRFLLFWKKKTADKNNFCHENLGYKKRGEMIDKREEDPSALLVACPRPWEVVKMVWIKASLLKEALLHIQY